MAKGWTEERRQKQAERCRQNKPWEKSTGPRTEAGKKAGRYNAVKHGHRSRKCREALLIIEANREFLRRLDNFLLADDFDLCKTNELIKKLGKSGYYKRKNDFSQTN